MDGLKQRIVGALVLVSLAVIFVPMLFDEPRQAQTTKTIDIPEQPAFPEVRIEKPQAPDLADQPEEVPLPADADTGSDESGNQKWTLEEIPDQPKAKPATTTEPDKEQSVTEEKVAEKVPEITKPEPSREETTENHSREALKGAWLVQLGSFGNQENANRLRDSVIDKGYDAFTTQYENGGKTLTRVISGPFAKKTLAQQAKSQLDKAFGVNSLVMSGDSE
ncbi:SPOR domain-containing protein [Marinobacteraceae bacterium S3BR75-40.1]